MKYCGAAEMSWPTNLVLQMEETCLFDKVGYRSYMNQCLCQFGHTYIGCFSKLNSVWVRNLTHNHLSFSLIWVVPTLLFGTDHHPVYNSFSRENEYRIFSH